MMFLKSEKAASEIIGYIIIFSITVTGIAMLSLVGVPAIYKMEDMANVKNVEQAYAVLDTRASGAVIGDSPSQKVDVNLGGGILSVEPNGTGGQESYLTVRSSNGTINITVPMGKVKYRLGERTVAYEGGGIWSKYPSGGSVMLSPPELNYNGVTLTLPIMNISGSASVGGKGTAAITFEKGSTLIFYPNTSLNSNYTNPVNITGERLTLNITSEYYDAWADFANSIAYASTAVDVNSRTVSIGLTVVPLMGTFPLGPPIQIIHLNTSNPNPMYNFSVFLVDSSGQQLNHSEFEIEAKKGNYEFEIKLEKENNNTFEFKIEFENSTGGEEEWKVMIPAGPGNQINFDFLNKSLNLTAGGNGCPTWANITCTSGVTNMSAFDLIQHYMVLIGPDITFVPDVEDADEHGFSSIDMARSTYTLNYDAGPGLYIVYMYITDNQVNVDVS